jgi:urea-proton symporter
MATNSIAPVLPEGAGYGVVVGIGVCYLNPIASSHRSIGANNEQFFFAIVMAGISYIQVRIFNTLFT